MKNLIEAKPFMPTIAFIKQGNAEQEIAARRLGVDAVLSEDTDDNHFRNTVCQLLGISAVASMQTVGRYNGVTDGLYGVEFNN